MSDTATKRPVPIKARSYGELFDLLKKTEDEETKQRILKKIIPLSDDRIQAQEIIRFTEYGTPLQRAALKRMFDLCWNQYNLRLAINFALDSWKGTNCNGELVLLMALSRLREMNKSQTPE